MKIPEVGDWRRGEEEEEGRRRKGSCWARSEGQL
jgi:hypothetical protein